MTPVLWEAEYGVWKANFWLPRSPEELGEFFKVTFTCKQENAMFDSYGTVYFAFASSQGDVIYTYSRKTGRMLRRDEFTSLKEPIVRVSATVFEVYYPSWLVEIPLTWPEEKQIYGILVGGGTLYLKTVKPEDIVSPLTEYVAEQAPDLTSFCRMAPGEDAPPYLLAPEDTLCYGVPYESPVTMELSCQLVRVLAEAESGTCPLCGDTSWVLADVGAMDAVIDTLYWVPRCALKTYEEEDRANLTWPLRVKPGLTLQMDGEDVLSDTLGLSRGVRLIPVQLTWEDGSTCTLPEEDVLTPDPALVSAVQDGTPAWEELFAG